MSRRGSGVLHQRESQKLGHPCNLYMLESIAKEEYTIELGMGTLGRPDEAWDTSGGRIYQDGIPRWNQSYVGAAKQAWPGEPW